MKTHCNKCGTDILCDTADRTKGRCMPCYRKRPFFKIWEAVVLPFLIVWTVVIFPFWFIWEVICAVIPQYCPIHKSRLIKIKNNESILPENAEIPIHDPHAIPKVIYQELFPLSETHTLRHTFNKGYFDEPINFCPSCLEAKIEWITNNFTESDRKQYLHKKELELKGLIREFKETKATLNS